VARAFARGHVERLGPPVAALAERLLDAGGTEFDLLADYAEPLAVSVIAELLGVPEDDRHLLRPWSNAIVKMYEYGRTAEVETRALAASREFAGYLRDLAAERRTRPREDLVSHLTATDLTGDELVASAILLLNAGHEASVNVLGNGVTALLRHPAQWARLRAEPALVAPAVEEMIRYDSPLHLFERTATTDATVAGVPIASGQKVAALIGAANRDPAVFAAPDAMDVGRDPNPHIGFGAGLHFCLGAPLARVELRTALATLLRRMPGLSLAEEPRLRPTFVIRGYQSVRVTA